MSEFLSNLVARTLATVPVLQPRQPSLFEPVGGGWGLGNRDWGVVAEAETAVSVPHPPTPLSPPPPVQPVWPETAAPPIQPTRPVTAVATPPPTTLVQPQLVPERPREARPSATAQPERPAAARPEKKPAPTPPPMTIRERIIQQTVVEKKERLIPVAPPPAAPPRPAKAAPEPAVTPSRPAPPPCHYQFGKRLPSRRLPRPFAPCLPQRNGRLPLSRRCLLLRGNGQPVSHHHCPNLINDRLRRRPPSASMFCRPQRLHPHSANRG
jgi:hypothetical protein